MRFFMFLLAGMFVAACIESSNGRNAEKEKAKEVYVTASRLNIRTKPSMEGRIVKTVSRGDAVFVFEENDGWSRISSNSAGDQMWAASRYLSDVKPKAKTKRKVYPRAPRLTNDLAAAIAFSAAVGRIGKSYTVGISSQQHCRSLIPVISRTTGKRGNSPWTATWEWELLDRNIVLSCPPYSSNGVGVVTVYAL